MLENSNVVAVILAAGEGTRMRSNIPKVLHPICGSPMIEHVLAAVEEAGIQRRIAVIGHGQSLVSDHLGERAEYVVQEDRKGTAHAVMMTRDKLADFSGDVLICCGDTPLLKGETLARLVEKRRISGAKAIVLTAELADPTGYGRILRDALGRVIRVVEQKDCTPEEAEISEVNTGVYCVEGKMLFDALDKVDNNNAQSEYYLPDVLQILAAQRFKVDGIPTPDATEMVGVNSRKQLANAGKIMRLRIVEQLMQDGVTIVDPESTFIHRSVEIGRDTIIHPFTTIEGATQIGESCDIGPSVVIRDSRLGNSIAMEQSTVEHSVVEDDVRIRPFVVVGQGCTIGKGSKLNSFVELEDDTIPADSTLAPSSV
jgi:bifunctional UDP-N-acetylglucosamine pyrophosphorylase/glucosamine-1-phosphate N-acetyltransferase